MTLNAPCVFCGYNGPRYWLVGTHAPECPWHDVGGQAERDGQLRWAIAATCARANKAEARVNELEAEIEAFKAKLAQVVNAGDRLCLYAECFGAFSEPARSASVVAWDAARKEACGE